MAFSIFQKNLEDNDALKGDATKARRSDYPRIPIPVSRVPYPAPDTRHLAPDTFPFPLHRRLISCLIPSSFNQLGEPWRLGVMNDFSSCFRREPRGGDPNDRRSSLALALGRSTARLCDRVVEDPRTQPWRFLVTSTGSGFMQVDLNNS